MLLLVILSTQWYSLYPLLIPLFETQYVPMWYLFLYIEYGVAHRWRPQNCSLRKDWAKRWRKKVTQILSQWNYRRRCLLCGASVLNDQNIM